MMKPISKLRFDILAGYSRAPAMPLFAHDFAWFEEAGEKVLGVLGIDVTDGDFIYWVLGRDRKHRFRAVTLGHSIPTEQEAYVQLEAKLAKYAVLPAEEFYQDDETGKALDFLKPVVATERQHFAYRRLISDRRWSPARAVMEQMMHYFEDADGNFVQQFQSAGFDARLWELYLYALFTEFGYGFDRSNPAPDYHCIGLMGDFFIEATTVNPSDEAPSLDDSNRQTYFEQYVPIKFGSALYSKLKKRYWELPHVDGHPLLIAVQDFHAPQAMTWSSSALVEYLYAIRQIAAKPDGGIEQVRIQIESYKWEDKEVPAGFFFQPDVENLSAVLANPSGTIMKFNRMGFLAGFGDRDLLMKRFGTCYRESVNPESFLVDVHSPDYSETWSEGLSVYHNPRARFPLDPEAIPAAAHHFLRDDVIMSRLPPFHPLGSMTMVVVPD